MKYIKEYRQQAIKLYSTTLSMEIIDYIDTNIFNKNYTSAVSKIVQHIIVPGYPIDTFVDRIDKILSEFKYYIDTKTYLTLDINNVSERTLFERNRVLRSIDKNMPKNFKRNQKELKREFKEHEINDIEYLIAIYSQYRNRDGEVRKKIDSLISSSNKTIGELIRIFDDSNKGDFDGFIDNKYMSDIMSGNNDNISPDTIVWKNNDSTKFVMYLESLEELMDIGKYTFWCHTYADSYNAFNQYSRSGVVWILVNTEEEDEYNLIVLTNNCDGPDWESEFELLDNDEDEYDNNMYDGEYDDRIFHTLNRPIDNPHRTFKVFFENMETSEIIEILDL